MAEIKHPYNPTEISRVRRLIEIAQQGNNPQAFEIFADGMRIVPRTTKLEIFDEAISEMLPQDFALLEVKIYFGGANLNDNHQFERQGQFPAYKVRTPDLPPPQKPGSNLGELIEQEMNPKQQDWLDKRIREHVEAERAKMKTEQLQLENIRLEQEIKDKDRYILKLEAALLEANKSGSWKEGLEGLVTTGLKVFQTFNGAPAPAQSLGSAPQPTPQMQPQPTQAAFEEETEEEEISEFEKRLRELIDYVNENFNAFQAKLFIDLLNETVMHRKRIPEVLHLVRERLYAAKTTRRNPRRNPQQQQQRPTQQQQPFQVVPQNQQAANDQQNGFAQQEDEDEDDFDENETQQ